MTKHIYIIFALKFFKFMECDDNKLRKFFGEIYFGIMFILIALASSLVAGIFVATAIAITEKVIGRKLEKKDFAYKVIMYFGIAVLISTAVCLCIVILS